MERHLALDLTRGLAALGVAVYHWLLWNTGLKILSLGMFGVYLFFILSALTMAIVYSPTFGRGIDAAAAATFFRNRVARLLPLLALVASASWMLALYSGESASPAAAKAFLTGSGFFALGPPGFLSNSTGAWTLGIELIFYAFVPLTLLSIARISLRTLAAATLLLLLAQHIYLAVLKDLTGDAHWDRYTAPLTFAPFFALGFLVYRAAGERRPVFLGAALALLGAIAGFSLVWQGDLFRANGPFLLLTLLAGAAIYCANRAPVPKPLQGPSRFLGDISYALYLTHPFTYLVTGKLSDAVGAPPAAAFLLSVPAAMLVAYATFRLFERPARERLRGGRGPRPAVATLP